MADESPGKSEPTVLSGWRQIARYLGKSVRTVQRWEHDLGLPLRKIDTQTKSDVVAFVSEIEVWVRRGSFVVENIPLNEGAKPRRLYIPRLVQCLRRHPKRRNSLSSAHLRLPPLLRTVSVSQYFVVHDAQRLQRRHACIPVEETGELEGRATENIDYRLAPSIHWLRPARSRTSSRVSSLLAAGATRNCGRSGQHDCFA